MKVTSENDIDLNEFEAWEGGKDRLDVLIENGHWKDAQAFIEEVYPEGIDKGVLNDWLWFEAEDQFPGWFFDDTKMCEVEGKVEELNKGEPRKPWFEADGGVEYFLETEREDVNAPELEPTLKLQAVARGGNSGGIVGIVDIDYDFSDSFEDNLEKLLREMRENDILPALPSDMEYVESFPCWAAVYFMNDDASGLSDDDRYDADVWALTSGYGELVNVLEETHNDFDKYPAFGKACETETAVFRVIDKPVFMIYDVDNDEYIRGQDGSLLHFYDEESAKKWLLYLDEEERNKYAFEKVFDPEDK